MTEPESIPAASDPAAADQAAANPAAANPAAANPVGANPAGADPVGADPAVGPEREAADRPGLLARILDWLRAGYPQGVPKSDYVALFAVLHRHLTDYEVVMVAEELVRDNPDTEITRESIVNAIARFAMEQPDPVDVARVAEHLAEGGWLLEDTLADSPSAEVAEPSWSGRPGPEGRAEG